MIGGVGPTLGASFARRCAAESDAVALWARSDSYTTELAAELADTPGEAVAVEADVTDPGAVADTVEAVDDALGTVDVHVHDTPVPGREGRTDSTPEDLATTRETVGYGFAAVVDTLLSNLRDGHPRRRRLREVDHAEDGRTARFRRRPTPCAHPSTAGSTTGPFRRDAGGRAGRPRCGRRGVPSAGRTGPRRMDVRRRLPAARRRQLPDLAIIPGSRQVGHRAVRFRSRRVRS